MLCDKKYLQNQQSNIISLKANGELTVAKFYDAVSGYNTLLSVQQNMIVQAYT